MKRSLKVLMKNQTTSFLYSLVMDPYSLGYNSNSFDLPLNHKVFLAAFDTIKELASKGPCVFVGRCADYALEDFDNCISVYVHAPFEDRIKRIENEYGIPNGKSKEMLMKKKIKTTFQLLQLLQF